MARHHLMLILTVFLMAAYAVPVRSQQNPKVAELQAFIAEQLLAAGRRGHVQAVFSNTSVDGSLGPYDESYIRSHALQYLARNLQNIVVDIYSNYVLGFATPQSNTRFLKDIETLAPVVDYYKTVYAEDLSDVVVIVGSAQDIPLAKGTVAEEGGVLAGFKPPVTYPISLRPTIPLVALDPSLSSNSTITGLFTIDIQNRTELILQAMKLYYGSEKLFHISTAVLQSDSLTVQSIVAHELRHLVDTFKCLKDGRDLCELIVDQSALLQTAQQKRDASLQRYLEDPITQLAKADLFNLGKKFRNGVSDTEQAAWAESQLIRHFDAVYLGRYPYLFSEPEARAYREQLIYLLSRGLTKSDAIGVMMAAFRSERLNLQINGQNVTYAAPAYPWVQEHFEALMSDI